MATDFRSPAMSRAMMAAILAGLLAAVLPPMPAHAQRRGQTMKVTAADSDKASVTPTDEGFVRGASAAYQMGGKLAMLAAVRASSADVKALGSELVKDFIRFGSELKPSASGEKGYQWANDAGPSDEKILSELDRLSGPSLDKALKVQLVALLERLEAACSAEVEKGRDPDLKPTAQKALPWIVARLEKARKLGGA